MDEDIVELSAADLTALTALFRKREQQIIFDERANTLQVILPKGTAKMEDINRLCFENGIVLNHLILKKKRLEARFFELTNN